MIVRFVISVPFILLLVQYYAFASTVIFDPKIDAFWRNHGTQETVFGVILCAVVLNFIWSNKFYQRLTFIGLTGLLLVSAFWIGQWAVDFRGFETAENIYIVNITGTVLFVIGYIMALSVSNN